LVALLLTLTAGLPLAAVVPFVHGRTRAVLVRAWFRTLIRAAGARLVVRGAPEFSVDRRGTLVTANHVSWLDIPALLAVEPLTMVAKTEVRAWPVIGLLAARGGTIFIDRERLTRLPATVADMATSLRRGDSVMVFPEGTTWCGRTHGPFRRASFQAAIDAGAPVRTTLLRYVLRDGTATTAVAFLGEDTLLASVRRVIAVRGLVIEVEIGPALAASPSTTRRDLADAAALLTRAAAVAHVPAPHPVVPVPA
jgi:1-acyl-sn-glycerol-3-phosphate acyltransferase